MKKIIFFLVLSMLSIAARAITAEGIVTTYHNNEFKADELYKNKRIKVEGTVFQLGKDYNQRAWIKIVAKYNTLIFYLSNPDNQELSSLSKGDSICIEGECLGKIPFAIKFEDAVIISKNENFSPNTEFPDDTIEEAKPPKGYKKSMVNIEGKNIIGAGFVTSYKGRKVIVTNIHVLYDKQGVQLLDNNNNRITPGKILFAQDRDLAIIEITDSNLPELKLSEKVSEEIINTPICVAANNPDKGKRKKHRGMLVGIEPSNIDISATFAQENSGSPIVCDNEVIGIATYQLIPRPINQIAPGTELMEIRRFGERIDNLEEEDLEECNFKTYAKEMNRYLQSIETCQFLYRFLSSPWATDKAVDLKEWKDCPDMYQFATEWNGIVKRVSRNKQGNDLDKNASSSSGFKVLLKNRIGKYFSQRRILLENNKFTLSYIEKQSDIYKKLYSQMLEKFNEYEQNIISETSDGRAAFSYGGSRGDLENTFKSSNSKMRF